MPIYERCPRCHRRRPAGGKCTCTVPCASPDLSQRTYQNRHKYYDSQRDPATVAFYHSAEWHSVRAEVLERDQGIDIYLLANTGVLVAADTVHHITPLKENWSLRADPDNLISLSAASHAEIEQAYKSDGETKRGLQDRLRAMIRRELGD